MGNANGTGNGTGTANGTGTGNADGTGNGVAPKALQNGNNKTTNPNGKTNGKSKTKRNGVVEPIVRRKGQTLSDLAIVGESQVLPKNVIRVRYILQNATADKGYDDRGKEFKAGASLNVLGHAFVAEYGITDRLVLQMIAPYTSRSQLAIDADTFRKSQVYEAQFSKLVEGVAPALIAKGICSDVASCRTAIDKGLALGVATPLELPTGERATVGANVPVRLAIDSIILKAIEPSDGKTGVGDIQIGAAYNVYTSNLQGATVGLGVRFPTGSFTDVTDAYRPTGAGFQIAGLLLKYDLRLSPVVISFSHQFEYALNKAKQSRSSLLNPRLPNSADPTADDPQIPGAGDRVLNTTVLERKGVYNEGYARVAFALGALTRYLKPAAVYAYAGYSVDPEYQNQGTRFAKKKELYTASYALSLDGLALDTKLPVSINYKHDTAIGGRNAFLAPDSDVFQFSFYWKF